MEIVDLIKWGLNKGYSIYEVSKHDFYMDKVGDCLRSISVDHGVLTAQTYNAKGEVLKCSSKPLEKIYIGDNGKLKCAE